MNVQIGDIFLYRKYQEGGEYGKKRNRGIVTHLGEVLSNGHVRSFVANGREIISANLGPLDCTVAVPKDNEQYHQAKEMVDFIKALPESLQARIIIVRERYNSCRYEFADKITLKRGWIRTSMIECSQLYYEKGEHGFGEGKPAVEENVRELILAGEVLELPESLDDYR